MSIHLLLFAVLRFGLNTVLWDAVGAGRWLMRARHRQGAGASESSALAAEFAVPELARAS